MNSNQVITTPITEPLSVDFIDAEVVPAKVAIAYNPYSADSLMAAALALFLPENEGARCVPYNPFGNIATLFNYDRVMFVGVEITKVDYTRVMNNSGVELDLVCYRDSYAWMTDKIKKNANHRVSFQIPTDEHFSELTTRTDNTAVKVVQFMLQACDVVTMPANFLGGAVTDLVARQVSQSYPVMPMVYDLGEGVTNNDEEMSNKALIYDLVPKLRMALGASLPLVEVSRIRLDADVSAYLSHYRHVRYALVRSLHERAFNRGTKTWVLPVSPASELTHGDILHAALQNYDEVLTYEDVGEYRVWRICSPKAYDRQAIAEMFKPLMTWSEGVVLCAVSKLPPHAG